MKSRLSKYWDEYRNNKDLQDAILKRIGDFSEKFSIASFAVGVYQGSFFGYIDGFSFLFFSLFVTWRLSI
jgi:hypothetical protein